MAYTSILVNFVIVQLRNNVDEFRRPIFASLFIFADFMQVPGWLPFEVVHIAEGLGFLLMLLACIFLFTTKLHLMNQS